ncbi:MAG: extracellular solute-binding protein [Sphaerochaeta sp.]|jgi:ABC-type glycerol-3-phosphate transport system substrate-binding protein|nr:MAG: extracellular solute-binding protein [Sphaerochaeta sp.]
MKRIAIVLLVLVLAMGMVFAQGKGEKEATGRRTLRISAESWQISKIYLEKAKEIFEKNHPDVDVEIITLADQNVLANYVIDWSKGNTETDLVFLDGGYMAKTYLAQGLIYDFDKELNFFKDFPKSKYQPGALETGVYEGVQVCVPAIYEVYGISLNKKMFQEAGLVDANGEPLPMKTWDDFYKFSEKLTKKDAGGVVTQVGSSIQFGNNLTGIIGGAVVAQRGYLTKPDGYTYDFDYPEFVHMIELWQKGVQNGYISTSTFVDNAGGRNGFKAGQIAMVYEAAGRWMEAIPTIGIENLSLAPIPGGKGTFAFGCQMAIPKASKNADLAMQFIKEGVYSEYVQVNTFTKFGKMSVIKEHFNKALDETPMWKKLSDSMENGVRIPQWQDQAKWLTGLNVIFQEGLVDPKTSARDIVNKMTALSDSLKK